MRSLLPLLAALLLIPACAGAPPVPEPEGDPTVGGLAAAGDGDRVAGGAEGGAAAQVDRPAAGPAATAAACVVEPTAAAPVDDPAARWIAWQLDRAASCFGDHDDRLEAPAVFETGAFRIENLGGVTRLRRLSPRPAGAPLRLGVIAGVKELDDETAAVLTSFLARFDEADVEAILLGGDIAYTGLDLERILRLLAGSGRPVLAITGNNDSRGSFNRTLRNLARELPNVLNMDLVRRLDAEGLDVVSLPGYHLKPFTASGAACLYDDDQIEALGGILAAADDPVVLLAHGPPRQEGKKAIDFVPGAGNVGHAGLAETLTTSSVRVVVAGHILEAGARATDRTGRRDVPPGAKTGELFLNPGQASALPYQLTLGWTSYGTGALVTIEGDEASWELLRAPPPAP